MGNKLLVSFQDPVLACASFGNLVVSVIVGELTLAHVDRLVESAARSQRSAAKGKTAGLSVIRLDTSKVSGEVRARLDKFMEDRRDHVLCAANVVSGDGIAAAAARAAMTTLTLVGRSKYPTKTFRNTREGAEWALGFAETAPTAEERAELLTALAALERTMGLHLAA